jgi:hypothetical protein
MEMMCGFLWCIVAMATLLQPYETPLVYYDMATPLTLEDTLQYVSHSLSSHSLSLPLFSALQQLSQTVDSVFSKINHKLNDERAKVSKVNERVQTCAGKINLIRGSNKATTIFSTAKFPTSKQLMLRKTLFGINEEV